MKTDHPPERCFARCEATLTIIATIPADLSPEFTPLAGEHRLDQQAPGHFRAAVPWGETVQWLVLENASAGCVLWFGAGASATCRPGLWGRERGIDMAELLTGVVLLPAREPGRDAAIVKLAPALAACSPGFG